VKLLTPKELKEIEEQIEKERIESGYYEKQKEELFKILDDLDYSNITPDGGKVIINWLPKSRYASEHENPLTANEKGCIREYFLNKGWDGDFKDGTSFSFANCYPIYILKPLTVIIRKMPEGE
jgi:hypothetical protein